MDSILHDLRFALRMLARTPAFTIAAVLTLALGIGANTAIFSVVDGVLLRRAPVADADRLMMVWETDRKASTTREPSSLPDFLDFQQRSTTVQQFAAFTALELNITRDGVDPQRVAALGVTHEFMPLLGLRPIAGRLLDDAEMRPDGPRGALISEDLWERVFQRDAAAVGATIRLNDVDWTVAGVLGSTADFGVLQVLRAADYSRGFAQRGGRPRVDVWVGLRADATSLPRSTHPLLVMGRLADGATVATAQQELTKITADLEQAYRDDNDARGAFIEPLETVVFGPVRPALLTLLGAVALVLLVACVNVANLFLIRSAARTREVTVRVALGAGTRRLTQQFLVESAVLTACGTALGIVLAYSGLDVLRALAPASLPRIDAVTIDGRVLALTLGLSTLVALAFGMLPSFQARNRRLHASLQGAGGRAGSAGREHRRFRSALVVSEFAMAAMLMVGAGLLIKSLWRLQQVDAGFTTSGVLKAEYQLPASRYPRPFDRYPNWVEAHRFNDQLRQRVSALPGVEAAVVAGYHPLDAGNPSSISVVGRESEAGDWPEPAIRMVGADYMETMRVGIRDGRGFAPSDDATAPPVALINGAALERFFGGRNAIGQQINLWGANRTVVGVIANERFQGLQNAAPPAVYLPVLQAPPARGSYSLLIRVRGDPAALAGAMRAIVHDLDPALATFGVEPLTTTMANSVGQQRFTMIVLGAFAAVALLLAAIGVHGVLSYAVLQRTNEIGIRMALGASGGSVRKLVLGEGAILVVAGLALGLTAALALTRALSSLLFGVSPYDALTFGAVAIALTGVAMFATYLPARRAARVDPLVALRAE